MKTRIQSYQIVFLIMLLVSAAIGLGQNNYGSFCVLKTFEIDGSLVVDEDIAGFCYSAGWLWCMTNRGNLVKIDTTDGSIVEWQDLYATHPGWSYGPIWHDGDTLWVVSEETISALDATGDPTRSIDFSPLYHSFFSDNKPLRGYDIERIAKDERGFWILQNNILFYLDRTLGLTRQYPNVWFGNHVLSWYDDKLLVDDPGVPPSGHRYFFSILMVNPFNGDIVGHWEYPGPYAYTMMQDYLEFKGIARDGNCYWAIEKRWPDLQFPPKFRVRKLLPSAPLAWPDLWGHQWGDFRVVDWAYCPVLGGMIEGLYGFGYDQAKKRLWFGRNIGVIDGLTETGGRYAIYDGIWGDYFTVPRDLCVLRDTLWIVSYWPGVRPALVTQLEVHPTGEISPLKSFSTGLAQLDGIATDGTRLWVSGRQSLASTGQTSHEIKIFNDQGAEQAHFIYPNTYDHNYGDLTFFRGYLWAMAMDQDNYNSSIHMIEPETGVILHRFKTGWVRPDNHLNANLASDGDHLLVITCLDPLRHSVGTLYAFENMHELLLRLDPVVPSVPPAAPELLTPVDGATDQSVMLTLNWTSVSGATKYHMQVASDSIFAYTVVDIPDINETYASLQSLAPGTTYFWRVRATNESGLGPWSCVWKFTTVIQPPNQVALLVPGNGAIIEDDSVWFSWRQAGPEVIRYWFELATHADMSEAVIDTLMMAQDTSKLVDQLLPNQRYWWRVRARNKGGLGPWSPIWNFTVVKLPDQVTLVAPLNFASIHTDSVQFIWRSSTSSVTKYWFEIASDSFMTHPVIDTTLTAFDTSKIVHALVTQTYWWRVKAKNLAGWGSFSGKYTFSVLITKVQETPELPGKFSLSQNYPNPFNPTTVIQYSIPKALFVELSVFDVLGQELTILVDERQEAGIYQVPFDSQDLPAGLYFYRLRAGEFCETKKMIIIK